MIYNFKWEKKSFPGVMKYMANMRWPGLQEMEMENWEKRGKSQLTFLIMNGDF